MFFHRQTLYYSQTMQPAPHRRARVQNTHQSQTGAGFKLHSPFKPTGDQPQAIAKLTQGVEKGMRAQTLLGVTGSGKTFTMANVIANTQRPTLIISHNKTLAAQLASEFEEFFPENAVHYFISYYDYYQPEAYIAKSDTYIEKETDINEEIDRLRHASTQAVLSRRDVIIVASVSCIYGLGSPAEYRRGVITITKGQVIPRANLIKQLTSMQFERRTMDIWRGAFRVLGDVVEIFPTASEDRLLRIQTYGDRIEKIEELDALTGKNAMRLDTVDVYPNTQYVTDPRGTEKALKQMERDLNERIAWFKKHDKPLEAERIEQRTRFDLEMMRSTGFAPGIENYSRYFDGRKPGTPPYTLMDFFPKDYLLSKLKKQRDKLLTTSRCEILQYRQIRLVHRQQIIKTLKIRALDLTSAQRAHIIAPLICRLLTPHIRCMPDMKIMRPGRIDQNHIAQARIFNIVTKHSFSRRRAADITHADEQN